MNESCPVVVVGAGPAGLAAATLLSQHEIEVTVLDDQLSPGGQIYRQVSQSTLANPEVVLGSDYISGKALVEKFLDSGARYLPGSSVWGIDRKREVSYLRNDVSGFLQAEHLILGVGSQERPMPFPGWQLPGILTAGGAQIMLKSQAMVPVTAPILVGSGPLLLLLAWQYLNLGLKVKAIVDTTPTRHYFSSLRHISGAFAGRQQLKKGLKFINEIRAAGIPEFRGVTNIRAFGEQVVEGISFDSKGKQNKLDADLVFIHQGVIPQLQLPKLAECELRYLSAQKCWSAKTDRFGESTVENIHLVGDGQQINGAELAEVSGQICALNVLKKLNRIRHEEFDKLVDPLLLEKKKQLRLRHFLDELYTPSDEFIAPCDDTLICRCEEVSAATIREIARGGCQGPNQAKSFSRCGMGHCQGRFCEATVSALIAKEQQRSVEEVGFYRVRPPIRPLTLGQLGAGSAAAEK